MLFLKNTKKAIFEMLPQSYHCKNKIVNNGEHTFFCIFVIAVLFLTKSYYAAKAVELVISLPALQVLRF